MDRERSLEAVRALARASSVLERASSDLSLAHYRVLSAIAAGDHRATRIAAKLAIGKPAVSATVESLRQRGLLQTSGVAGDNRATALALTPDGEALLQQVLAAHVHTASDQAAVLRGARESYILDRAFRGALAAGMAALE